MEGVYDYNAQVDVQWPFGYGLSYTTFDYSNMRVDKTDFTSGDVLTISVDVKNTGRMAGKESVLLFSRDMVASLVPESRRLRAFTKVDLKPGEQRTVTFTLPADDLAFVGNDGKRHLEPGEFLLQIADKSLRIISDVRRFSLPNGTNRLNYLNQLRYQPKHQLSFSQRLDDAGHLVGDADMLGTLFQTFLAVGALSRPGRNIGQRLTQAVGKLLLTLHIVGRLFVG